MRTYEQWVEHHGFDKMTPEERAKWDADFDAEFVRSINIGNARLLKLSAELTEAADAEKRLRRGRLGGWLCDFFARWCK